MADQQIERIRTLPAADGDFGLEISMKDWVIGAPLFRLRALSSSRQILSEGSHDLVRTQNNLPWQSDCSHPVCFGDEQLM
jgi:hypothetical protein